MKMKNKHEPQIVTTKMVVQFLAYFITSFLGFTMLDYAMEYARIPTVLLLMLILGWITVPHIYRLIKELR